METAARYTGFWPAILCFYRAKFFLHAAQK